MSYRTEDEARDAGEKTLARMRGERWSLRVWDNLGWHYEVYNWPVSLTENVFQGERSFCASMTDEPDNEMIVGTPTYFHCPGERHFADPNDAVDAQMWFARRFADRVEAAVSRGEEIIQGAAKK